MFSYHILRVLHRATPASSIFPDSMRYLAWKSWHENKVPTVFLRVSFSLIFFFSPETLCIIDLG